MAEGKGGQLLGGKGSPGLIMRGAGMFFSLGSLLFTHKKGKAKRTIVIIEKLWMIWISVVFVFSSERFTKEAACCLCAHQMC